MAHNVGNGTEPLCTCGHRQEDHGSVDDEKGTECCKVFLIDGRQLICTCTKYAADPKTKSLPPYRRDLSANSIKTSMAAEIRKDDYLAITERHMHEWKDGEEED